MSVLPVSVYPVAFSVCRSSSIDDDDDDYIYSTGSMCKCNFFLVCWKPTFPKYLKLFPLYTKCVMRIFLFFTGLFYRIGETIVFFCKARERERERIDLVFFNNNNKKSIFDNVNGIMFDDDEMMAPFLFFSMLHT